VIELKVYIYSLKEVEKLLKTDSFPKNVGVIEIHNCNSKKDTKEKTPTMDLILHNCDIQGLFIDDLDLEELNEQGLTIDTYFPHVERTAFFINRMYSTGRDIVCCSRNGRSRSSAFAAAILEYYYSNGNLIFSDNRYSPNILLYRKLLDTLRKELQNY